MNSDDFIPLRDFASEAEASLAEALRRSEGCETVVVHFDPLGAAPILGARLLVSRSDEARAREILDSVPATVEETEEPVQYGPPDPDRLALFLRRQRIAWAAVLGFPVVMFALLIVQVSETILFGVGAAWLLAMAIFTNLVTHSRCPPLLETIDFLSPSG